MRIKAPILNRDNKASAKKIADIVKQLPQADNSYVILEQEDSMFFVKAQSAKEGFIITYQQRELSFYYNYRMEIPVTKEDTTFILDEYFHGRYDWKNNYVFQKKDVTPLRYKIGYNIGSFIGNFVRGFNEGRTKKKKQI